MLIVPSFRNFLRYGLLPQVVYCTENGASRIAGNKGPTFFFLIFNQPQLILLYNENKKKFFL